MTIPPHATMHDRAQVVPSAGPDAPATTVQAPHVQLIQMAVAIWAARAVYAAARLGIADHLAGGPRSADELAAATQTHAPSLQRLLRALASRGVLTEVAPAQFALTNLGSALRSCADGGARATILTLAGEWQWKAWDNVLHSLRTGETGLKKAFGASLFGYLDAHPDDGALFDEAMVGMHGAVGPAVASAYDFSPFPSVIDVGGGTGALISAILDANPGVKGILYEQPATTRAARAMLAKRGLSERCDVVEGNFFQSVPGGHDAYVLSHVLHDWTDAQALPLLRNCRQATGMAGRLIVIEAVLPPGDTPHHGKLMDLLMLTVTGGLERTAEDFSRLLSAGGFKLSRIVPTATHQSVIEALPI